MATADDLAPAAPTAPARPVQVAPESYEFDIYDSHERWSSYWYQIRAALRLRPRRVLEIGSGTGVFRMYLRSRDIEVVTADIDATRGVDFLADVSRLDETLPPGETFDLIAAFQVLEHLPFSEFERSLAGIARRARPYALISLPHFGFQMRLSFAIGALRVSLGRHFPFPWKKPWNGEHYWELGFFHPVRKVTRIMERYFHVLDRHFIRENPYHYLWVLKAR